MPASSRVILRASASIKPQVNSAVGCRSEVVPLTMIPRSAAAFLSIDALTIPVVTRSFSFGSRIFAFERVAKSLYLQAGTQAIPVGHGQSYILIVVENRKPHTRIRVSE